MLPLSKDRIAALSESDMDDLALLDAKGLFPGETEGLDAYKQRLLAIEADISEIMTLLNEGKQFEMAPGLEAGKEHVIDADVMAEAASITEQAYRFAVDWVPGFYLSKSLGMLWGGCAIIFDTGLPVFLIRSSFARSRKWLWYRRDELLSHELCHAARNSLQDRHFEEMFAYRLSFSAFRRGFGDCFQTRLDAFLFLLPVLALLGAQIAKSFFWDALPIAPFWCAVTLYPLFLVIRSFRHKRLYRLSCTALEPIMGDAANAILFRCSAGEITTLAARSSDAAAVRVWLEERRTSCLRWGIMDYRFGIGKKLSTTT